MDCGAEKIGRDDGFLFFFLQVASQAVQHRRKALGGVGINIPAFCLMVLGQLVANCFEASSINQLGKVAFRSVARPSCAVVPPSAEHGNSRCRELADAPPATHDRPFDDTEAEIGPLVEFIGKSDGFWGLF
jgi:hypothetical protein